MLEKTFSPESIEAERYERWEKSGVFAPRDGAAESFTIMMPPPNVTGSLHIGHAFTMTLQDILTRYHRMKGKAALWQPGTDHAGIATQMVVERQLGAQGISKHDLGRDGFLKRVWEWKAESGGTIVRQLRRLGASPDWSRERFTMDEGLSKAVLKVFVQLYREGLIYRDKRLVNWDPKLHTAISDLEVEQRETKGHLWHLRYPIEGEEGRFITVATTRPETMLGDTAVAVNPEDERYSALIGRFVTLPLTGRRIPIVGDDYADPEHGSGAVKITPAHDFNDFEVGNRHGLERINIFDADAKLLTEAPVPEAYRGLDRFEARKRIVADLEAAGLLEKIDDITHTIPYGDRSGVVVEPWLTDQWYCRADVLAKPAIEAVETGRTKFVPQSWENTYFQWMRNIQPWCISRQLWWGHQIPAWYAADGSCFVAENEAEAYEQARAKLGADVVLTRDPDVLDTWFSSALWPFSTLGWPEQTEALKQYYPTDVLVTGFDIIFFWVARMMMMGLHFMGDVPFRTVYIHALVRDAKGQKMSKTKGNVMDPLDLIDKYGADAIRFTLAALAAPGRDIKLAEARIEGYRNFATKIWNAARYGEMNGAVPVEGFDPAAVKEPVNRWIVAETAQAAAKASAALEAYRFDEAASGLYAFVWNVYCDWYLEFTKPLLQGNDADAVAETRATMAWALDQALHLLNPIMPYITEELFEKRGDRKGATLISADWPSLDALAEGGEAAAEMQWLIRLISAVRSVRADMNVPPAAQPPLVLAGPSAATQARVERNKRVICRLARVGDVEIAATIDPALAKESAQFVLEEATGLLRIADLIDFAKERDRLKTQIAKLADEVGKIDKKLGNADFVARAPEEVVEEQRERRAEALAAREKLNAALAMLGA
jgi:valyl-tRNA synthetase